MSESDATRVAVVTGANRGMGLETCRQLAERGLRVVLTSRDEAKGKAAAEQLQSQELEVDYHPLDVTDAGSVDRLASYVRKTHGRLDVLVNNAGAIFDEGQDADATGLLKTDPDVIRKSFETNCMGAVLVSRALAPLMIEGGYGRIVNVSTGMAALSTMDAGWPGYRISKAALNALTRLLSEELADRGVKVNAVCPGHVQTDMGGPDAKLPIEEGVDTTVWLATLRDDGPTGGFFRDYKAIPW